MTLSPRTRNVLKLSGIGLLLASTAFGVFRYQANEAARQAAYDVCLANAKRLQEVQIQHNLPLTAPVISGDWVPACEDRTPSRAGSDDSTPGVFLFFSS